MLHIERAAWSAEAEQGLQVSAGPDMDIIRGQVERGTAKLWRCTSGSNAAWVVTRYEPELRELVMVLGEGSGFMEFAPHFVNRARALGIKIRAHTQRRGMVRLWARLGVRLDEFVLRG